MSKNNRQKSLQQPPSLLKAVVLDLFVRHWLVSALAVIFISSSMALAHTSHKSRRLTAEWQQLRQHYQVKQIEWESLRLELTTLSEPDRINNIARKELGMVEVTTKNERVISL